MIATASPKALVSPMAALESLNLCFETHKPTGYTSMRNEALLLGKSHRES